jgi:hypothetical protein
MPEWAEYVKKGKEAGTMCHKESCFIQELCQEAALKRRQNTWVDGSLRDVEWFSKVFADIRQRYPHYRVGIIVVVAAEKTIRTRIEERRVRTGRGVPEHLLQASLSAPARAFLELAPLCDWLIRVDNELEPTLTSFLQVDRSQCWTSVQERFAIIDPAPHEFPNKLAPIAIDSCKETFSFASTARPSRTHASEVVLNYTVQKRNSISNLLASASTVKLLLSPLSVIPGEKTGVGSSIRKFLGIPERAVLWAYAQKRDSSAKLLPKGGFMYLDENFELLGMARVTGQLAESPYILEFQSPTHGIKEVPEPLQDPARWSSVTMPDLLMCGASKYAWVCPTELSNDAAGFVYQFDVENAKQQAAPGSKLRRCANLITSGYSFFPLRRPTV